MQVYGDDLRDIPTAVKWFELYVIRCCRNAGPLNWTDLSRHFVIVNKDFAPFFINKVF